MSETEPEPRHRPIRSFVLREGRLTPAQERAFRELWPRFGIDWRPELPLDLRSLFGDERPLFLEIGFGNGETLTTWASRHSEKGFIGIEVHRPGIGHLLLDLDKTGLSNVRVLRHDAVEALEFALPPASLDGVYLFFPDPWPKKRHQKRRLINPPFIGLLARVIRPGGLFHAATDWEPYAQQMLKLMTSASDLFRNAAGPGSFSPRPSDRPLTKFERRGQRLGHAVRDLVFIRR